MDPLSDFFREAAKKSVFSCLATKREKRPGHLEKKNFSKLEKKILKKIVATKLERGCGPLKKNNFFRLPFYKRCVRGRLDLFKNKDKLSIKSARDRRQSE